MKRTLRFFWRRPGWTMFVAAACLGAWWWIGGDVATRPATPLGAGRIDYYMDNFTALFIEPDGGAPFRLSADFTAYDNVEQVTVLHRPVLDMQRPGEPHWRVTAGAGIIAQNEDIHLREGVSAVRDAPSETNMLQAYTEELIVAPGQGEAHTDAAVTLFDDRLKIDARGMRIHFKDQRVQLRNRVRARYVP